MNASDKKVNKRDVFVTVGCAMYPYARIKEMIGDRELCLSDMIELPLEDEDKVVTIEKMGFFDDSVARTLALRYARLTYQQVAETLNEEEQELAEAVLKVLEDYLLGHEAETKVEAVNGNIRSYLKEQYSDKEFAACKQQIGCLENFLSVSKHIAQEAMIEASSIQRDVLGSNFAAAQLEEIKKMI